MKNKDVIHTPTLDPILLQETGMDTEFDLIFQMVGWTNFWDITELGSRLLTIEFLCTLQYYEGYLFLDVQTRDHVVLEGTERPSRFLFKMHPRY